MNDSTIPCPASVSAMTDDELEAAIGGHRNIDPIAGGDAYPQNLAFDDWESPVV